MGERKREREREREREGEREGEVKKSTTIADELSGSTLSLTTLYHAVLEASVKGFYIVAWSESVHTE